ncbi:MAG TPA: hypothetical protein VGI67_10580 [Thermoleophilaceae bacterium]
MNRPPSAPRRGPLERGLAWLYTGPLGFLYGVLADVAVLWARYGWSRLRRLQQQ